MPDSIRSHRESNHQLRDLLTIRCPIEPALADTPDVLLNRIKCVHANNWSKHVRGYDGVQVARPAPCIRPCYYIRECGVRVEIDSHDSIIRTARAASLNSITSRNPILRQPCRNVNREIGAIRRAPKCRIIAPYSRLTDFSGERHSIVSIPETETRVPPIETNVRLMCPAELPRLEKVLR